MMFNQTECYNDQDKGLHNDSIVAIVVAGCSLITTIGTFAYFKLISKFKDMQQSEIELTTEQSGETNKTVIKVKFVNDEQFEVSSKSAKNGKDNDSSSPSKKIFGGITSTLFGKKSAPAQPSPDIEMTEIVVKNFHDAIDNNNSGDKIIAVTRKGLVLNAFNTFLKTVKVYNVSEEQIIDISENRSRSNSDYHDLSRSNSDSKNIPDIHSSGTTKSLISIPSSSHKVVYSKSCPEVKAAKEKTVAPELSLGSKIVQKNPALDIIDTTTTTTQSTTTTSTAQSANTTLNDTVDNTEDKKKKANTSDSEWQLPTQISLYTRGSLSSAYASDIYPEKFKPNANKKRPSLTPLIESDNEGSDTTQVEETKISGDIFED